MSVLTLGELESVGRSHLSLLGALEAEDLPRISPVSPHISEPQTRKTWSCLSQPALGRTRTPPYSAAVRWYSPYSGRSYSGRCSDYAAQGSPPAPSCRLLHDAGSERWRSRRQRTSPTSATPLARRATQRAPRSRDSTAPAPDHTAHGQSRERAGRQRATSQTRQAESD